MKLVIKTWLGVAAGWLAMLGFILIFRPLLPVDETRYFTVAWEMLVRDTWLLPTLNFEPYSHKPPLLFWLIRGSWEIFGVGITPVRIMLGCFILGLFALTAKLARAVLPAEKDVPAHSILLLTAMPLFLVYSSVIMFDCLLTVFVLAFLLCLWKLAQKQSFLLWGLAGVCIGFGILAKGPVMLVYCLPVALLAPFWAAAPFSKPRWYAGILVSVLVGAAVALSWAVPAALEGGPAYAEKIFLKQSAGRMVNAFDHQEPFWFYFLAISAFLAPFFIWPDFWRGIKTQTRGLFSNSSIRFLACQIVPTFVFFSLISSKQVHYLVPIMPAAMIMLAYGLSKNGDTKSAYWPVLLSALPSVVFLLLPKFHDITQDFLPAFSVLHIVIVLALAIVAKKMPQAGFKFMAASSFILIVFLHAQLGQSFFTRYDLSPMLPVIEQHRAKPLAVAPKYDGEYGYELQLTKGMAVLEESMIDGWLQNNPDGLVITRDRYARDHAADFKIYHEQEFRTGHRIAIIGNKD